MLPRSKRKCNALDALRATSAPKPCNSRMPLRPQPGQEKGPGLLKVPGRAEISRQDETWTRGWVKARQRLRLLDAFGFWILEVTRCPGQIFEIFWHLELALSVLAVKSTLKKAYDLRTKKHKESVVGSIPRRFCGQQLQVDAEKTANQSSRA